MHCLPCFHLVSRVSCDALMKILFLSSVSLGVVTKSAVVCCVDAPPMLQQRAKRLNSKLPYGGSMHCGRASKTTRRGMRYMPAHARFLPPCMAARGLRVIASPWSLASHGHSCRHAPTRRRAQNMLHMRAGCGENPPLTKPVVVVLLICT